MFSYGLLPREKNYRRRHLWRSLWRRPWLAGLVLLALLSGAAAFAMSGQSPGGPVRVREVANIVRLQTANDAERAAQPGDELLAGGRLWTGPGSLARLDLGMRGFIRLRSETTVELLESAGAFRLQLERGRLFASLAGTGLTIETDSGVIVALESFAEVRLEAGRLTVNCLGGGCRVQTVSADVTLGPLESATLSGEGALTRRPLPAKAVAQFIADNPDSVNLINWLTALPAATATPTASATHTRTHTATLARPVIIVTVYRTPTPTASATATRRFRPPSATATLTETPTATPTDTSIPDITDPPTETPTSEATPTDTPISTATATETPEPPTEAP